MTKRQTNKVISFSKLQDFELLIYGIMKSLESSGEKLTLENIHFKAVEYMLKHRPNFEGNTDTIKTLKKIAIDDKTTGEWKLKPIEFDAQGQCAIITKNAKE